MGAGAGAGEGGRDEGREASHCRGRGGRWPRGGARDGSGCARGWRDVWEIRRCGGKVFSGRRRNEQPAPFGWPSGRCQNRRCNKMHVRHSPSPLLRLSLASPFSALSIPLRSPFASPPRKPPLSSRSTSPIATTRPYLHAPAPRLSYRVRRRCAPAALATGRLASPPAPAANLRGQAAHAPSRGGGPAPSGARTGRVQTIRGAKDVAQAARV